MYPHRADDVVFFVRPTSSAHRPQHARIRSSSRSCGAFVINEMLKIFDQALRPLPATGGPMLRPTCATPSCCSWIWSGLNTLMDIPRVLADDEYRKFKLSNCKSRKWDFWEKAQRPGRTSLANMVPCITSKLASFIYNDYMRPIVGPAEERVRLLRAMNRQKIILVKLSKEQIGDLSAYLLGMIFVGKDPG